MNLWQAPARTDARARMSRCIQNIACTVKLYRVTLTKSAYNSSAEISHERVRSLYYLD